MCQNGGVSLSLPQKRKEGGGAGRIDSEHRLSDGSWIAKPSIALRSSCHTQAQ